VLSAIRDFWYYISFKAIASERNLCLASLGCTLIKLRIQAPGSWLDGSCAIVDNRVWIFFNLDHFVLNESYHPNSTMTRAFYIPLMRSLMGCGGTVIIPGGYFRVAVQG
jgi:hypothetical protein